MTEAHKSTEREVALNLAERLMDAPNCDPDDELRVLSRQLLRQHEEIVRLRAACAEAYWAKDLMAVDRILGEVLAKVALQEQRQ